MTTNFLVVGLPRSGTTYLMTLLNSHPDVRCEGEIFNPHGIIGAGWSNRDGPTLIRRDTAPGAFLDEFYGWDTFQDAKAVGGKWMIGHHPEIMDYLQANPDVQVINVYRENKLAQVASHMKAVQTKQWATRDASKVNRKPIDAGPRMVAQKAREKQVSDRLFSDWLDGLPNAVMEVEYRGMFTPGFNTDVCRFLDVPLTNQMASPLVKQGSNDILSRFAHSAAIAEYFSAIGQRDWLDPEL